MLAPGAGLRGARGGRLLPAALANEAVSGTVLILAFVPIMLLAAGGTWQRAAAGGAQEEHPCPPLALRRVVVAGAAVGVLTGFFGVGGGFVIVPVLTLWLAVSFRHAVATSLVVITLTGAAALGSHLLAGASLDVAITATLAGATAVGAYLGTLAGGRLPQQTLARGFALLTAGVAVLLLVDTLALGGPPA